MIAFTGLVALMLYVAHHTQICKKKSSQLTFLIHRNDFNLIFIRLLFTTFLTILTSLQEKKQKYNTLLK